MKQLLFLPREITERCNCYDRFESLVPYGQNPIIRAEKAWEGTTLGYPCVLYIPEEKLYKCWYLTLAMDDEMGEQPAALIDNSYIWNEHSYICYATSEDGVTWRRPAPDIMLSERFPGNNIVYRDAGFFCGSATVVYDPEDPNRARLYKLITYDNDGRGNNGIRTMASPDGIHWTQVGLFPVLPSQDTPSFWKNRRTGEYVASLKDRIDGQRARLISFSRDFESWT